MSNWTSPIRSSGVSSFDLPPEVFNWLKKACDEAKQKGNRANKHLLGHMKEEYHLVASEQQINQTKKWKEIQFVKMNKDFIDFLLKHIQKTRMNIQQNMKKHIMMELQKNISVKCLNTLMNIRKLQGP